MSNSKKSTATRRSVSSRKSWRLIAYAVLTVVGCLLLVMLAANMWVISSTRDRVFDDISRLGFYDIGLVLGTSPFTRHGSHNKLFEHRMRAAAKLYSAGRVRHLLLSGANPSSRYNEPRKMYQALRRLGVPDSAITLDYAGFRTLDSIVRARRVFGLKTFVVISQRYHDYRALFLADHFGIDATAYTWPDEDRRQPVRTEAREFLARFKAVLDLFVFRTEPHFLGPRRPIEIEAAKPFDFLVWATDATSEYRESAGGFCARLSPPSPAATVPLRGRVQSPQYRLFSCWANARRHFRLRLP